MKSSIYIVSEETVCEATFRSSCIFNQSYFYNKEKAFDYFRALVEHKLNNCNYKFYYDTPISFDELKPGFLKSEFSIEAYLKGPYNSDLFIKLNTRPIKNDSKI